MAVLQQAVCGNAVEGRVLSELVRASTLKSKWETTVSVEKDCHGFGSSTRHKRVQAERGMLATRT